VRRQVLKGILRAIREAKDNGTLRPDDREDIRRALWPHPPGHGGPETNATANFALPAIGANTIPEAP